MPKLKLPKPSPIWCAYYSGTAGCSYIQWGHPKGPKLDFEMVERWAKARMGEIKNGRSKKWLNSLHPARYGADNPPDNRYVYYGDAGERIIYNGGE